TVDKPARRRITGKPGADQPEAPPGFVLDPVIVADRCAKDAALLAPPLLGDALGAFGPAYPIGAPPPGEAERRRRGGEARRRGGRREQAKGARRLGGDSSPPPSARRPPSPACGGGLGWGFGCNRGQDRSALGDVAVSRLDPAERNEPEPRADPVAERGDTRRNLGLLAPPCCARSPSPALQRRINRGSSPVQRGRWRPRASGGAGGGKRCEMILLGRQWFGGKQREDHILDAEPGVDLLELFRQQRSKVFGVAARPGGAEADLL